MTQVVDPNATASGTTPNPGAAPAAPAAPTYPELSSLLPPEYKDKPWVKETKDVPSLFKRVDDLITEIGKKPKGIPQDNATEEEWKAFNKAIGVPDKPEDYEIPTDKDLPVNEEFQKGIRGVLQKAGVSKRQAKVIAEGYNGLVKNIIKADQDAAVKMDEDFDKLAGETFGDRREKVLSNSKALIAKFVPEKMKGHIEKLSNENLIVLAGVLDGIQRQYIKEDEIPTGGGGVGPMTDEQRRAEGIRLMSSEAYTNSFHPDHEATVKKVRELYKTN